MGGRVFSLRGASDGGTLMGMRWIVLLVVGCSGSAAGLSDGGRDAMAQVDAGEAACPPFVPRTSTCATTAPDCTTHVERMDGCPRKELLGDCRRAYSNPDEFIGDQCGGLWRCSICVGADKECTYRTPPDASVAATPLHCFLTCADAIAAGCR